MKNRITRLQALAIGQLALVASETVLGLLAMTAFPNEGGNGIFNTLVAMLLLAFAIPAVMTFYSAGILVKPKEKIAPSAAKSAIAMQKALFIVCIVLVIPSISLAFNGFVFFALNCVAGLVLWPMVNKESKSFHQEA